MNNYVSNNARWLEQYDSKNEQCLISSLLQQLKIFNRENLLVYDIGCGSGRSAKWIGSILPQAHIVSIDIKNDSIDYALQNCMLNNVDFICADAFKFFLEPSTELCDVAFFSWSLFDMVSSCSQSDKAKNLQILISNVKRTLKENGAIIVLQPTKGGMFEKLLSEFIPDSDDDYLLTHNFLLDSHFLGAETPFPEYNAQYAIWSNFICDYQQLFQGIEAVVMLETGRILHQEEFEYAMQKFPSYYCNIDENGIYHLTDCVNIYFWVKGNE